MTLNRRTILSTAAGLGLGGPLTRVVARVGRDRAPRDESHDRPFRALTYNVHAFGPVASADEGKRLAGLARARLLDRYALELALYEPDVLCVQEASSEELIAGLAERLELHYVYLPGGHRDEQGRTHPMFNGAILTRHTIVEHENCPAPSARADRQGVFSRHMGRVLLETGDERWGDAGRVAVIGCHMLPSWENTTSVREAEIRAVGEAIHADVEAGRSLLVLGDMNHRPTSPEYAAWEPLGLVDCAARRPVGAPETIPSLEPEARIDYVFAHGPIAGRLQECRVLAEGRFRLHAGGDEVCGSFALSDHLPVLARFV